jgi:hypothetical protein
MLTGTELIAKVNELQATGATKTEIVLACGYTGEDGKAAYLAFYRALSAAKYPNGLPNGLPNSELELLEWQLFLLCL